MNTHGIDIQTNVAPHQFCDCLREFETGMLVTHSGQGLHARPMVIADIEDEGHLWFITGWDTPKMEELRANREVLVSFQNERNQYISVSGRAEMIRDPQKVSQLWRSSFDPWFPQGQNDPNIALIHVQVQRGEFWDQASYKQMNCAFGK
jgi:general stress protein 26